MLLVCLLCLYPTYTMDQKSNETTPLLANMHISIDMDSPSLSLTQMLPADVWKHIMNFLPGNSRGLQLLACCVPPSAYTQENILNAFKRYLVRPGLNATQRAQAIDNFYKMVKYADKDNALFHFWDEVRTAHKCIEQFDLINHFNLLNLSCRHIKVTK